MADTERDFQNDFENWNDSLSGLQAFKGTVMTDDRRSHLMDYADVQEMIDDE